MEKAVVVINGVQYDAENAVDDAKALIQDLATVQAEMNKVKITYDIASIARQALLGNIASAIATGESGLVVIEEEEKSEDAEA